MAFFRDKQGRFHAGRFCGVLYTVSLFLFSGGHLFEPVWFARATFTLGWWLAFGQKEGPRTSAEMVQGFERIAGLVLATTGLGVQFFLTSEGFSAGPIILPLLIVSLAFVKFGWGSLR